MKPGGPRIACVTAAPEKRDFLKAALHALRPEFYPSAAAFLGQCPSPVSRLAVLDQALPDMSGRDLAAALRREISASSLLLVLLGGPRSSPAEISLGLENGADDYFDFPPEPGLFRARLLNLLARGRGASLPPPPGEFRFGGLVISPEARTVAVGGKALNLTALEFDLLAYFLRTQGRVISRSVLLEQVWKGGTDPGPRSVDKRLEVLRSKLGPAGAAIRTVFGLGYIFKI